MHKLREKGLAQVADVPLRIPIFKKIHLWAQNLIKNDDNSEASL